MAPAHTKTSSRFLPPSVLLAAFVALCLLLLYVLAQIFAPFMTPILWAMILARLFYPLYRRLTRILRGWDTLSAAISTLAVMFLAVLPVAYLSFLAVTETVHAYQGALAWLEGGGLKRLPELLARLPIVGPLAVDLGDQFAGAYENVQGSLVEGGKAVSAVVLSGIGGLARNTFELVTDFMIMLFTLFFFFRDGRRLYDTFYDAIPIEDGYKAVIFARLNQTMVAVVRGTLLTAVAQGTAAGLAYWALGVPFPVFLGIVSGFCSLVPFGGTALVWAPVAAYLFATASVWKGLIMIAIGLGLVGTMDNLLQPFLVGSGADIPVLFLFFASIGGLAYFGFIGLFLGPILLAIAIATFQIYRENYATRRAALPHEPRIQSAST